MARPPRLTTGLAKKYDLLNNTLVSKWKGAETEVGDALQPEFVPQVKIKKWDNEANFSMRYISQETGTETVAYDGDTIKWKQGKVEAHFYDKGLNEDGGYEFSLLLLEKPASNVFNFSLQHKELEFAYQAPLTDEQIAARHSRPENVVGSYAVFHKTKQGDFSKMGGQNYMAGKAFHIFRPELEDADGVKVYGDLHIDPEANLLTVTVPQDYLDSAAYPVLLDPTLGYTTVGASNSFWATGTIGGDGQSLAPPAHATITSMSLYGNAWDGNNPCDIKTAVYDYNSGSLIDQSAALSINNVVGWKTLTMNSKYLSPTGGSVLVHHPAAWIIRYYDDGVGIYSNISYSQAYPTFPDPITGWSTGGVARYSLYATYTAIADPATQTLPFSFGFETNTLGVLQTFGSENWATQSTEKNSGTYAVKAGPITDFESAFLRTAFSTTASAAFLTFAFKVSSELGWDYLRLKVDGVEVAKWSGEQAWQNYGQTIWGAGTHIIEWSYTKDSSSFEGSDTAWIDEISITTSTPGAFFQLLS